VLIAHFPPVKQKYIIYKIDTYDSIRDACNTHIAIVTSYIDRYMVSSAVDFLGGGVNFHNPLTDQTHHC